MKTVILILLFGVCAHAQYRQLAGSSGSVAGNVSSATVSSTVLVGQSVVGNASGGEFATGSGIGALLSGTIIRLDAEDGIPVPLEFSFPQNFPNPFNPSTTFQLTLPKSEHVKLTIFDLLGREAARVVDSDLPAGAYSLHFDAPAHLSSGLYFAVLDAGPHHVTRKLVLLK